jgi:transcriptional regulator with XRE-family HTH domain
MAIFKDSDPVPNKFTIEMGQLIKLAREEVGLSQDELSKLIFRRRETLSMIENGRSEVGTITLARIAAHTEKPLTYFFPKHAKREIKEEALSTEEQMLLNEFRNIPDEKLQEIAIRQVKSLTDSDRVP